MAVLICYCSKPAEGINALRNTDWRTAYALWDLPGETKKGDVAILFAAGRRNSYVGTHDVASGWKSIRSGEYKGEPYVDIVNQRVFSREIPAGAVEQALGIRRPRGPKRLADPVGSDLLRFLRARRQPIESALEGITTEVRRMNRSRNPKLRKEKLLQAEGRCEACGRDYRKLNGVDGLRVLTVHHRKQMADSDEPVETSLDDLAVLCANCHMLVHTDSKEAMAVEDLARLLSSQG